MHKNEMEVLVISAQNGNGMQFPKVFIIILFVLNLSEWLLLSVWIGLCREVGRLMNPWSKLL